MKKVQLTRERKWCVMDLVVGDDGKLVLTKLQAACFHLALFSAVVYVTIKKQDFIIEMWSLYAAAAIGHAVIDKSTKQYQDFKNKQLDADIFPTSTTESTTVIKTVGATE